MNETIIERFGNERAKALGLLHLKFTSPGRWAVPDRIVLGTVPPEHRRIVAKYIRFVEYKATGGKASPAQSREHQRLIERGFLVSVVDTKLKAADTLDEMVD